MVETNAHDDSTKTSGQGRSSGLAISISPKALDTIQYHKWTLAKAVKELLGPLSNGIPEGIGDERLLQMPLVGARTVRYFVRLADDALEDRAHQAKEEA